MTIEKNRTAPDTGWKGTKLVHWLKGHDLWSWDFAGEPKRTTCSCGKAWAS